MAKPTDEENSAPSSEPAGGRSKRGTGFTVISRFSFTQIAQKLSKEEEGILVDCYLALYRKLEEASK